MHGFAGHSVCKDTHATGDSLVQVLSGYAWVKIQKQTKKVENVFYLYGKGYIWICKRSVRVLCCPHVKKSVVNSNSYISFYISVQLVHIAIKLNQVCNRIKTKCFSIISIQRFTVQRSFYVLRSLPSVFRIS